jgi:hypothetical protein
MHLNVVRYIYQNEGSFFATVKSDKTGTIFAAHMAHSWVIFNKLNKLHWTVSDKSKDDSFFLFNQLYTMFQ